MTMPTDDFLPDETTLEALAELPDDEPVVMLNLLEYADDQGEAYASYGRVAWEQIKKRGGSILYDGAPVLADPAAGKWDRVIFVQYPTRAAFIDMMRDPDYRKGLPHRRAGLKRAVLYAFKRASDGPPLEAVRPRSAEEIFVLNLMRFKPEGGREEYQKYGDVVLPMILERGGAPVLKLDAQLPLVSDEIWEDLYFVRYPELGTLQTMVATDAWQSANEDRLRGLDLTWAFPTRP
jgi:uncharacterized protein (DUF1330 family)